MQRRNKTMNKYQQVKQEVNVMTDDQIVELLVELFGKGWFRGELMEWIANSSDLELDLMKQVIEVRKEQTNE